MTKSWLDFVPETVLAQAQRLAAISPLFNMLMRRCDEVSCQNLFLEKGSAKLPLNNPDWIPLCEHSDLTSCMTHLRQIKHRGMRHIIWWEMGVRGDIETSYHAISELASGLLSQAVRMAEVLIAPRFGRLQDGRFCVIGLGKHGGNELNLGSDIDPLFIWQGQGDTSDGRNSVPANEYFMHFSKMVIRLMSEATGEGVVWPMDMRLRPGGDGSSICLNIEATLDFYQNYGQTWERAMLIKARPVAGDLALGEAFVKGLAPFIYRRYLDYTTVAALAEMKRRIDRQSGAQAFVAGFDVKRGQGGIREIEFIIQSMQLLHGGVHPDLRVTPSMLALKRLTDFGVLDGQESERLRDAYRFWRSVEHAVQARVGEQTQKLPEGFENYLTLALGDEDPKASMRQHADYVQRAFARHVLPLHAESTESWLLGGYGHMFNEFCQDDQQRIRNAMARIDTQLMRGILPERSRKSIETILSYAMPKWLDDANALVAIDSFADLIYAIAGRATWIDLLATHQGAREWLIGVLSASRYLADYLVKTPSLLEWPLSEERGDAEIQRIKEDILQLSIEDEEVFLSSLGRLVDFARMQCALQIDAHQADPLEIGSWMSDIADAAVQMCLRSSLHQLKLPDNFPLVALAMGKHGSREMGLVSDLDMVLVLADDGLQQMQGRSVGEWAQRVGRRVIRQLSGQNPFGAGYEFDARLRPSGNSGILVIAMNGFRQYQLHEAQTWEHQALCRARAVAGPESACREVMMVVREVLSLPRNAALLATEVVAMREKMFEHLGSHSDETINLKLDHGGLVDVEFIAQTARLLFDVEATGTVAILRSLPISASQQWHDTGRQLADTYVKYRQMENILRVELWLSIKALPANDLASEWETFRRHAAIVSVEQLRKTMGDVHRCYQYLMEMLVSSN